MHTKIEQNIRENGALSKESNGGSKEAEYFKISILNTQI